MVKNPGLWTQFEPPGPKAAGWLYSDADIAVIVGPYGSAKTTTGSQKCMRTAIQQHPSTVDGVRRAQIAAVRPNYRRMHDTLIPSVRKFFGDERKGTCEWDGPKNGPQDLIFRWREGDVRCELEILFRAFGDEAIESFVRGFEPTAWWGNEFDELPMAAISQMKSRAGRYRLHEKPEGLPPVESCKWFGDCNMPDLDSWVHDSLLKQGVEGVEVFMQPSGFDPEPENITNLRRIHPNYYQNMAADFRRDGREDLVKRFIENKAGYTQHGKPVYPMFDADRHIADHVLTPDPNRQLIVGVDQGGQAAAWIGQRTASGAARLFDEVVLAEGEFFGGYDFGELVGRLLMEKYRRWCVKGGIKFRTDPAARQRHSGTSEDDPRSWFFDFEDGVRAATGMYAIDILEAPTNEIGKRVSAVVKLLTLTTMKGEAGFLMNKHCVRAARGFAGGYRYASVQGKPGQYRAKPEKNNFADIHDAGQYFALEVVPEIAGEARNANDPYAEHYAAQLEPQGPGWNSNQATEILM
jgi:hypothetical protein